MSIATRQDRCPKRPTMAVLSGTVSTPGAQVKQARIARGLSQPALAKLAGVSIKTIGRIETETDYKMPRSLPKVQRALGLGAYATHGDPPLSKATPMELINELSGRLSEAERIVAEDRIRRGTVADQAGLAADPDVILGPPAPGEDDSDDTPDREADNR